MRVSPARQFLDPGFDWADELRERFPALSSESDGTGGNGSGSSNPAAVLDERLPDAMLAKTLREVFESAVARGHDAHLILKAFGDEGGLALSRKINLRLTVQATKNTAANGVFY